MYDERATVPWCVVFDVKSAIVHILYAAFIFGFFFSLNCLFQTKYTWKGRIRRLPKHKSHHSSFLFYFLCTHLVLHDLFVGFELTSTPRIYRFNNKIVGKFFVLFEFVLNMIWATGWVQHQTLAATRHRKGDNILRIKFTGEICYHCWYCQERDSAGVISLKSWWAIYVYSW